MSWLCLDAKRLPGFVGALVAEPGHRISDKLLFSNFAQFAQARCEHMHPAVMLTMSIHFAPVLHEAAAPTEGGGMARANI